MTPAMQATASKTFVTIATTKLATQLICTTFYKM